GGRPKATQRIDAFAGVTADQYAATAIGQDTMLQSIVLATEYDSLLRGRCHGDSVSVSRTTLTWRTPTTPLPVGIKPRKVSDRMFGEGGSAEQQTARRREDRSIRDALTQQAKAMKPQLGPHDRERLDLYLDSVREIERRLQRAESQIEANRDLVIPEAPPGIPFVYEDHIDIMFDLLTLAYQADITRVFTFMMARE